MRGLKCGIMKIAFGFKLIWAVVEMMITGGVLPAIKRTRYTAQARANLLAFLLNVPKIIIVTHDTTSVFPIVIRFSPMANTTTTLAQDNVKNAMMGECGIRYLRCVNVPIAPMDSQWLMNGVLMKTETKVKKPLLVFTPTL
jgi:hypothetical protein